MIQPSGGFVECICGNAITTDAALRLTGAYLPLLKMHETAEKETLGLVLCEREMLSTARHILARFDLCRGFAIEVA